MKLETTCPDCLQPVATTLPDETTEAEAQSIASGLFCAKCGRLRMAIAFREPVKTVMEGRFFNTPDCRRDS